MDIEKAKILDDILRRFNGDATVYWDNLRKEFTDKDGKLTREYFVTENNIKYLLGEGLLQRSRQTTGDALCMTDKGFAVFSDIDKLGYVKKAKKECTNRWIKNIGFGITIATFSVLLYTTFNSKDADTLNNNDLPTLDSSISTNSTVSADSSIAKEKSKYILSPSADNNVAVDTNSIIKSILEQTTDFDSKSKNFWQDTVSFFEHTTEGGEAIVKSDSSVDIFSISGTIFGEMGKTEYEFYLSRQYRHLLLAMYTHISYDRHMAEKDMKIKTTETEYQIFHNGILIATLDNKKKKTILDSKALADKDAHTKLFFSEYIGQIQK